MSHRFNAQLVLNISIDSASSCKTFNKYATESIMQLDKKDQDVLLSFLQGVHNLSRNFTANQNLSMTGQARETLLLLHQGNIAVRNTTRFNMSNLSIDGLSKHYISLKEVLDMRTWSLTLGACAAGLQ